MKIHFYFINKTISINIITPLQCGLLLFELVKRFLHEDGSTLFVGQSIVMEDFKEWQKKQDEERGQEFEEVIQECINMYFCKVAISLAIL